MFRRFANTGALVWLFCQLLVASAFATSGTDPVLSRYSVTADDATMHQIASRFEIIARKNQAFEVLVPASRALELRYLAPQAQLEDADISASLHANRPWLSSYHNFTTVQSELNQIVKDHPKLAQLSTYGKSKEGRPLYALKVTSPITQAGKTKPEIMISAATHGNELITVEVLFGLVHELVDNYGKSGQDRMTKILDTHTIFFLPVVNPDGYVREERYANGLDPNRDYPYPTDPSHRSNPAIVNEITFFGQHNIKGSIDFHSYGRLIMYPWAYTDRSVDASDAKVFDQLTSEMSAANGYQAGQISRILYVAEGSSADYYYWKNKTIALGIEIGDDFAPYPNEIAQNITDNLESTWIFIEHFK